MQARTVSAYRAIFDWLQGYFQHRPWHVERFLVDYERALHTVIQQVFGPINHGCWFHSSQVCILIWSERDVIATSSSFPLWCNVSSTFGGRVVKLILANEEIRKIKRGLKQDNLSMSLRQTLFN